MSTETVKTIMERALNNANFRQQLFSQPQQALNQYEKNLTNEEIAGLRALTPVVFEGVEATVEANKTSAPWWQPSSFKDLGAAVVSVAILCLLVWALFLVAIKVEDTPVSVTVDGGTQVVDTYDRAQDILNVVLPLFGGVLAFWLGVSIEGKRADENKKTADSAQGQLKAVLDESPPKVLEQAKAAHPELFRT